MQLAIFDLDNTLIGGDSDYLWGEYLCEQGIINSDGHRHAHRQYYEDYHAGRLDIQAFLRFQLKPLADNPLDDLERWRRDYIESKIKPILLPRARQLIEDHRRRGHQLLIITATNRFITEPIAAELGIENLVATEPEFRNGRFTGEVRGLPSYREGKVQRMHEWLRERGETSCEQWFYSDSHNDIPLLKEVDHPMAVDPDDQLREFAEKMDWPVISLR
ncbi:MAG: HAD family hydrolase [Gammaproteobacteria bacterium]|nr:HAD family hydrolase [Gammaproteobacteria bacterium]